MEMHVAASVDRGRSCSGLFGGPAAASDGPRPPAELYKTYCSTCHEGGVPRAPHSVKFQMFGPKAILGALETGVMRTQGAALSAEERRGRSQSFSAARPCRRRRRSC